MNTLKLTAAEFKKIFKRPSIFVMAILLVVSILVSIALFNPASILDPTITYTNANTAKDYYDSFNDKIINSKEYFDKIFTLSDTQINYYVSLDQNSKLLTTYYNNILDAVAQLKSLTDTGNMNTIRETQLAPNIQSFAEKYKELSSLSDFDYLTKYSLTKYDYYGLEPYNYYTSDACSALNSLIASVNNSKLSVYEFINDYDTNNYQSKLKDVLDNGIYYIETTLEGLSLDFIRIYDNYIKNIPDGQGKMLEIYNYHKDLKFISSIILEYLETLTKSNFPIVTVDKIAYLELEQALKDTLGYLEINDQVSLTDYNKHRDIRTSLETRRIRNYILNLSNVSSNDNAYNFQQIYMPSSIINNLNEIKEKTDDNKSNIVTKISDLKTDESTTKISEQITKYSLLASSYNQLVADKVYSEIVSHYDSSVYRNFHGTTYAEYNTYETNERIAKNQFYIDNNKYSNEYMNNFAFNQNSTTTTNAYDFMFFALELCTIIIIVFAMMLVCNLITGETESGTIKLLLVRPFKRSKILTAKLLATIFFVVTFMVFSTIISMVGGLALFGEPVNATVLAVANATTAFETSPFALMILNILFLTIDVIFFVLLALMISILFKNYAASITASIVLLIANYSLNIITGGAFWYTLLPGMNLHLFKYFGSGFVALASGTPGIAGILQTLLITTIESSMNLWFSILLTSIYSLVFLTISYSVFQRRDF